LKIYLKEMTSERYLKHLENLITKITIKQKLKDVRLLTTNVLFTDVW